MRESKLQIACVEYFQLRYGNRNLGLIVSVPNEGRRSSKTGGRLKKMGLCPGIPDLFIVRRGVAQILFIELKTQHHLSELSADQIEIHKKLKEFRQVVFTVRSLDEFILIVDKWFSIQ